jgi:hypothetical protein
MSLEALTLIWIGAVLLCVPFALWAIWAALQ